LNFHFNRAEDVQQVVGAAQRALLSCAARGAMEVTDAAVDSAAAMLTLLDTTVMTDDIMVS
jgi:hypothetical protein